MYVVHNCVNIIKSVVNKKKKQDFTIFKITVLIFIQGTQFTFFFRRDSVYLKLIKWDSMYQTPVKIEYGDLANVHW
jgi:hypothetical protein